MSMVKPNGDAAKAWDEYHAAWGKVIRRFEMLTGTRVTSYDPMISGHMLGNVHAHFQMPLWLVNTVNKLRKGAKRAKKKV